MNRDEKNRLFEQWYQNYLKAHDISNPKKHKDFARWAFWAGVEAAEKAAKAKRSNHEQ